MDWQSFYQVTGSASGALIGLLFIVATLNSGRQDSGVSQGVKLYTTPTVFHLALVLVVSALSLAPAAEARLAVVAIGVCVLVGLLYAGVVGVGLFKVENPHWSDVWFYGAAPVAVYVGLGAAAVAAANGARRAEAAIALLLLVLLMLAIRNAWDLVTWLAPRRSAD